MPNNGQQGNDSSRRRSEKTPAEFDWDGSRIIRAIRERKRIRRQVFLRNVSNEWEKRTNQIRFFDKLEYGQVHLTRLVIECVVAALSASDTERAHILEAAGYNGYAEWLAMRVQTKLARVVVALDDLIDGVITPEDLDEILHTVLDAYILGERKEGDASNEKAPASDDPPDAPQDDVELGQDDP